MYKIKETPTVEYLAEMIFKFFVRFEKDAVLLLNCVPKEVAIFFRMILPEKIRVAYDMSEKDKFCECGGKLHLNSYQDADIDKKDYGIKKTRYECSKCGKTVNTPLDHIVKKGCCYSNEIKEMVADIYSNQHIPYEKAAEIINEILGLNINKYTIYLYNKENTDKKLEEKEKIIESK